MMLTHTRNGAALHKALLGVVLGLGVLVGGAVLMIRMNQAPTPSVFDAAMTLDRAIETSRNSGKPVVAVATSDWCLMCQSYKRGALSSPEVQSWLSANAVPLYLEFGDDPEETERLDTSWGPGRMPATVVLVDGEVVATQTGELSAEELLAWLADVAPARVPQEMPEIEPQDAPAS